MNPIQNPLINNQFLQQFDDFKLEEGMEIDDNASYINETPHHSKKSISLDENLQFSGSFKPGPNQNESFKQTTSLFGSRENKDVLVMNIDTSSVYFGDETFETFEKLKNYLSVIKQKRHQYIVPFDKLEHNLDEINEDKYVRVQFKKPYIKTLDEYLTKNIPRSDEFFYQLLCLMECYLDCLDVFDGRDDFYFYLSAKDASIVLMKKEYSPYPTLCISPYAFSLGFFSQFNKDHHQKSMRNYFAEIFCQLFEYYQKWDFGFTFVDNKVENAVDFIYKQLKEIIDELSQDIIPTKETITSNELYIALKDFFTMPVFDITSEIENLESLNSGSYGKVYKVKWTEDPSKFYCLKKSSKQAREYLQREATVLKHLQHEHIVKCIKYTNDMKDIDNLNKISYNLYGYMLMEYCPYGNLSQYYNDMNNPYSYLNLLEKCPPTVFYNFVMLIYGQIIDAVNYLHSQRFVHRDLKFENIMVTSVSPYVHVKLIDFGFSRTMDTHMISDVGTTATSDSRMLDENISYTETCDSFSLGCILFGLLEGCYPNSFFGENNQEYKKALDQGIIKISNRIPQFIEFDNLKSYILSVLVEKNYTWNNFMNHPVTQTSLQIADQIKKQQLSMDGILHSI